LGKYPHRVFESSMLYVIAFTQSRCYNVSLVQMGEAQSNPNAFPYPSWLATPNKPPIVLSAIIALRCPLIVPVQSRSNHHYYRICQ
jgi:hypothetical protein